MRILRDLTTVNERSIRSLKRKALRRSRTLGRDTETQEVIQPSKYSAWLSKLKTPFTRSFWEDMFEATDNETLVDGKLLSYAYLEAGLIETLASYVLLLLLAPGSNVFKSISLVAYFVVFFRNGFSPADLVRAQKNGCM